MDDLFEQLKKAPAINQNTKIPPRRDFLSPPSIDDLEIQAKAKSSKRRESMPTSSSTSILLKKAKPHKSRSLSPPKNYVKPLRVLVERKKLEGIVNKNTETRKKAIKSASKTIADAYRELFKTPPKTDKTVGATAKVDTLAKEHKKVKSDKSIKSAPKIGKPVQEDKSIKSPIKAVKLTKTADNSFKLPIVKLHKMEKTLKTGKAIEKTSPQKKLSLNNSSNGSTNSTPQKITPTKAQKKEFTPCETVPLYENLNFQHRSKKQKQSYKTKPCVVRLPRQNLKNLQTKLLKLNSKNGKIPMQKSNTLQASKRKSSEKSSPSPTKRTKESNKKETTGFFIKLSSPSTTKAQNKKSSKTKKTEFKSRLSLNHKGSKSGTLLNNYKSSLTTTGTKPTKFTRTQLIKAFGKRFFKSHVKIEKCSHPLMLIFESNARARKLLQAKRNKSKNLSVSFKEQVEIFGCTDSEDYDSCDSDSDVEYRPKSSSARKAPSSVNAATDKNTSAAVTPLPATPARLKKVENGKVVDDIELDPALFLDPSVVSDGASGTSTPYGHSPGRKRREKKSFSPLKNDATSSPRREQFKLANEKMPPSGLRRLNIDDVDDEDDEDDEYIVPFDIPQRRSSYTNSTNAAESSTRIASPIPVLSPCEDDSDAPSPSDLRLDAPTPDNLEIDAPTLQQIGADSGISNGIPVTEYEKVAAKVVAPNDESTPIFTPITPKQLVNTSKPAEIVGSESMSLKISDTSEEENHQDIEDKVETLANEQEKDVEKQTKQLNENTIPTKAMNRNGENVSLDAEGHDTGKDQDISSMFIDDAQGEEEDIQNNLKERIDEIVRDADINDSTSREDVALTVNESNNIEGATPSNEIKG